VIGPKEIAELAARRSAPHPNSKHWHANSKQACESGFGGEVVFARMFGLPLDLFAMTDRPGGDDGIDFEVPLIGRAKPLTIDVKTATSDPWTLLVNQRTLRYNAELFVCMAHMPHGYRCMGWAWRSDVLKTRLADHFNKGKGSECHRIFPAQLRTVQKLCDLFAYRADEWIVGPA